MDAMKQETRVGHGGWKCPCCGPKPKDRPAVRRTARRRLTRITASLVNEAAQEREIEREEMASFYDLLDSKVDHYADLEPPRQRGWDSNPDIHNDDFAGFGED